MKKYLVGMIVAGLLLAAPVSAQTNDDLRAALLAAVSALRTQLFQLQQTDSVRSQAVKIEQSAPTRVLPTTATKTEVVVKDEAAKEGTVGYCIERHAQCRAAALRGWQACMDGANSREELDGSGAGATERTRCGKVFKKNNTRCDTELLRCAAEADWGI